ncbi:uncharacterized protein LOC132258012 [Phlebotomus argentipes]|uniref:uncharacterized protein LOC132258012 n=1 Tax=Phlebotomus argentipes TaxID=94469 RepID=UPI00289356ED|nr:uncharacterized protein LOC132258012 [Phlebotomus argentipes]
MLFAFLVLSLVAVAVFYLYQLGTRNEDFFLERGLKFPKPSFLLGNNFKLVTKQINFYDHIINLTRLFPKEKLMGIFDFRTPVVLILDPELTKQLAIKDFDNFTDHFEFFKQEAEPLLANSLFNLKGLKWKDMRSTLSPAFTGSKMRLMCDLMVEICEQMVDFLKSEIKEKGPQTYEMKELLSRLTTDVIGTCAFGVKVNSLKEKNNNFYKTARMLINFSSLKLQLKFMGYRMIPSVMKYFKIPMFDPESRTFMNSLVLDTIKTREEKKIVRHDMINLLMEAQKGNLTHTTAEKDSAGFATVEESDIGLVSSTKSSWTDDEVVAQCFIFFLAGYEGMSTFASFIIYEVMVNPDVQEKLFNEVSAMNKQLGGKPLKYDALKQMKYLDGVVSEGLRKWTGPFLDRVCTKDFTLKYDDGKEYTFRKGETFWIPIVSYHHNPDYFPDPEKFDPERFSDENSGSINPSTFAPFGIGPRNCIGSRFALMELKAIVYYSVLNFHLEPTAKTQIPVQMAKNFLGLQSERGIHVQFRPRSPKCTSECLNGQTAFKLIRDKRVKMLLEFLLFTVLAAVIVYIYQTGTKNEDFFLKKGIKHRKPVFLVGNNLRIITKQTSVFEHIRDLTREFSKEKLAGVFEFRKPIVLILDPEIAKQLTIKEFDSFGDRELFFSEKDDPLFGNILFSLRGQKWKDMRSTLSPAFTGSKMRLMCDLMVEICEQMVNFLKRESKLKGFQTYEFKELFSRLTTDVIGTCAFGIKVDSMEDPENTFYKTGRGLISFSGISIQLKFIFMRLFPKIMKFFKIPFFDVRSMTFVRDLVMNTIKTREEKKIVRHDMINLLMEAQKGNLTHTTAEKDSAGFATVEESEIGLSKSAKMSLTNDEIVAQCFLFFLAGFEGISSVTGFIMYEIMIHQEVQEKLFKEILNVHRKLNGEPLKYDTLLHLKYLDMVVSEALRLWTGPVFDRTCTRDFTLKYDKDKEYTFESGDVIWIPSVGYHHNPDYFPDPEKFDPERFNDKNKGSINPSTYVPFGAGPRNCIGSRFALMQLKAFVYYLILHFHVVPTAKTQIPLRIKRSMVAVLQPEGGIYGEFRPRSQES